MSSQTFFHLSLPCHDMMETRKFYCDDLGFEKGRSADGWTDFNLGGNQLTFMQGSRLRVDDKHYYFEGQLLPVFHFGLLLEEPHWDRMYAHCDENGLLNDEVLTFLKGEPGEHRSFFITDPNNYVIEFKCFSDPSKKFHSLDPK